MHNPIDRDKLQQGFMQEMARACAEKGLVRLTTPEERHLSRQQLFARHPQPASTSLDQGVWIFAYGSLIWNPAFNYAQQKPAKIYGYHRALCLKTPIGRGSPENPGLLLGLDRGGSCQGIAFHIPAHQMESELEIIWARELVTDSYRPTWVKIHGSDASTSHYAISFVMRRQSSRYCARLSDQETSQMISKAHGPLGSCRTYLENTCQALRNHAIHDHYLERIAALLPPMGEDMAKLTP